MRIEDLMTTGVSACSVNDSLSTAAQLMWERDCGCVPVLGADGSGRVVGMLTDRDICMATHFRGAAPTEVRVADAMSKSLVSIGVGDVAAEAEARMRDARVRRLPVLDENDTLLGIVSLADLARAAAHQHGVKKPTIEDHEIGRTLEAICEARVAPTRPAAAKSTQPGRQAR